MINVIRDFSSIKMVDHPAEISTKCLVTVLVFASCVIPTTVTATTAPADWSNGVSTTFTLPVEENRLRHMDTYRSAFISYFDETHRTHKNKSEVGKFGEGFVGPVSGYVYHVASETDPNDHTGCERPLLSAGFGVIPTTEPWIALIKRGKCNFELKVENAFRSKAAGVLVYDDRDKDHLDRMKLSSDNGRNISAVFTYKWKGEEIANLVDSGSRVRLNITVGSHSLKPFPTINRTSVLFVSISFIVLMIISLTWLVFYYVQRFRYSHAKDRLSRRLCNAAKKALSKIPTKNIKADDKEIEGDGECCAICIELYKVSDIIRILPCRHEFHKYCIDPWLLEHRTCPMCKMDILKHYGFVFTGSQESILHVDIEEPVNTNAVDNSPPLMNSPGVSGPFSLVHTISDRQQMSRGSSRSDGGSMRSSRATTPDELTPSLEESRHENSGGGGYVGVAGGTGGTVGGSIGGGVHNEMRQELCMACLQLVAPPVSSSSSSAASALDSTSCVRQAGSSVALEKPEKALTVRLSPSSDENFVRQTKAAPSHRRGDNDEDDDDEEEEEDNNHVAATSAEYSVI